MLRHPEIRIINLNNMNIKLKIAVLAATLVATFFVSCQHCTGGKSAGDTDSINWADSGYVLTVQVEYYFNADLSDSLELFAPVAMDFCREHELWRYYPKSVFRTMLLQNISKICQYVSLCY